jgi:hypothetical protein
MKIRPVGAELFHVDRQTVGQKDGQTDGYNKASSRFPQFYERASKEWAKFFSNENIIP